MRELIDEIDTIKHVVEEVGEQKDEELRVLTGALHELAIRNVDLERELATLRSGNTGSKLMTKSKVTLTKESQRILK